MSERKEFPINGLEQDVVYARKIYCYLKNQPKTVKWTKRQLNKRFRKKGKELCQKEK